MPNVTSPVLPRALLLVTSSRLLHRTAWYLVLRSIEMLRATGSRKKQKTESSTASRGSFNCNFAASRGKKRFLLLALTWLSAFFYRRRRLDLIYEFICIARTVTVVAFPHGGLSISRVPLSRPLFASDTLYKCSAGEYLRLSRLLQKFVRSFVNNLYLS